MHQSAYRSRCSWPDDVVEHTISLMMHGSRSRHVEHESLNNVPRCFMLRDPVEY